MPYEEIIALAKWFDIILTLNDVESGALEPVADLQEMLAFLQYHQGLPSSNAQVPPEIQEQPQ
ncbi:hypothetical protein SE18_14895 [Herpetosiphon geysericola]|uniref:Uncharacterized protein n=1 Tax=Herpetosiphon geysericola TaxID=70996 RepID=A0A0P6XQD2_9CHLR|nr:hypothetical protein SE18_14895 [Herpetosiphon geysericola]